MTRVSVSELKARLSAYLDVVRQGEDVLVTDRGQPIARLSPVRSESSADARRDLLIRTGKLRAPSQVLGRDFRVRPRPQDPEGRSLAALLEERDRSR